MNTFQPAIISTIFIRQVFIYNIEQEGVTLPEYLQVLIFDYICIAFY